MSVINTNVNSLVATNALSVNARGLSKSMNQLSTGSRINGAADDAAGLAISTRMTSQIKGLNQSIRNANDGIALLQTAEGSMIEITNMLQRMRELAVQSANDTNQSSTDRSYLNLEYQQLKTEIGRIATTAEWNGAKLLNGTGGSASDGTFTFHVGAGSGTDYQIAHSITKLADANATVQAAIATTAASNIQTSTVTISGSGATGDVITLNVANRTFAYTVKASDSASGTFANNVAENLRAVISNNVPGVTSSVSGAVISLVGSSSTPTFTISKSTDGGNMAAIKATDITSAANAETAIAQTDTALTTVNTSRANLGAVINRLTSTVDNLSNSSQNQSASRSRILDTDYASVTTELARTQIIQQAATAMLAQANQMPQTVLSLLK